jgi:hypothetical protein
MRSGAIRPAVRPGGARSCGAVIGAPDAIVRSVARVPGTNGVIDVAFARDVLSIGVERRGMSGEWVEQSCGAAVSVKPGALASILRWQALSAAGSDSIASTFALAAGAGQHSKPQANADSGGARSAITTASAAEVRSRI